MTDPISFPKLPVNLAEVVTDSPKRLQRTLNQKKGTSGAAASDRRAEGRRANREPWQG